MPNPQLDQLTQDLFWKAGIAIVLGTLGALLIRELLNWIDRRTTRFARDLRERRAAKKAQTNTVSGPGNTDAPDCPSCNRTMVKRTARRGARAGTDFWGCTNYPICRGTRSGDFGDKTSALCSGRV